MPRIHEDLAHGIAFLYPSMAHAEKNEKLGGTCFIVGKLVDGVKHPDGGAAYLLYAVSNFHVVWSSRASVIRLNRRDGNREIIDLKPTDWIPHPDGDDLAAVYLSDRLDRSAHYLRLLETEKILREQEVSRLSIGVGDDVFMIGRFINHQGTADFIRPSFRFGSISMGLEPIWNKAINAAMPSFAVEMRSRTGFSGSPVAVYRNPLNNQFGIKGEEDQFWRLLGINWGYVTEETTGENTWLNGVVPAWRILELLEVPALKDKHDQATEQFLAHQRNSAIGTVVPAAASADQVALPASDANPHAPRGFQLSCRRGSAKA